METLSEALDRLGAAGYRQDFRVDDGQLCCGHCAVCSDPRDVAVEEIVRFEGESDPDDEAIVLALSCLSCGVKGTLTLSYGPSMPPQEAEAARILLDGRPTRGRR